MTYWSSWTVICSRRRRPRGRRRLLAAKAVKWACKVLRLLCPMHPLEALLRRCPASCLHLRLCPDFCLHRRRVGGYAFVISYCWQGCTRNEKAKAFSFVTSLDGGLCTDTWHLTLAAMILFHRHPNMSHICCACLTNQGPMGHGPIQWFKASWYSRVLGFSDYRTRRGCITHQSGLRYAHSC